MKATTEIRPQSPGSSQVVIGADYLQQALPISGKKDKQQTKEPDEKLERVLPLYYTKPIFTAKEFDPL